MLSCQTFTWSTPTYRGAQPKPAACQRSKARIKTILNLRGEDEHTRAEGAEARTLDCVTIVSLCTILRAKGRGGSAGARHHQQADNQPVFVHCRHGQDRTGTIMPVIVSRTMAGPLAEARKEAEKIV